MTDSETLRKHIVSLQDAMDRLEKNQRKSNEAIIALNIEQARGFSLSRARAIDGLKQEVSDYQQRFQNVWEEYQKANKEYTNLINKVAPQS